MMVGCLGERQLIMALNITEAATPSGQRSKKSELRKNQARNSLLLTTLMSMRPEEGCHGCVARALGQQPNSCQLMPTVRETVDLAVGSIGDEDYVSELAIAANRMSAVFEKDSTV